ncbi:pentatricopeptide repeat-containing protein At2g13600-like [Malania oleifera]|uniref:pentatricopeptide repeat-containing protein At2g13600-like n=1 Tax=Malania oleifera TaxID=397392 RepID=UPI0025AE2381|nr:pentatricopeptide repeat-containing protein At2g13600-like [Malania oleifera]
MLSNTVAATRLPSICKFTLLFCSNNKYIPCGAHKLFTEICERNVFQVFDSLSKGFVLNDLFAKKSYHRERENLFVSGTSKHGNAYEGLENFCRMIASGKKPAKFILCSALNSCTKSLNWHLGLQIHACIIQNGYEENLYLSSALVDFYAKHDALVNARTVFDGLKSHDQVSWTSFISGFSQNGHGREAVLLFKEMLCTQIRPNCFTYVSVISACTGLQATLEQVLLLHTHVIVLGLQNNNFVVSSLIDCYSKYGRIDQAVLLFDATTDRDNIILNSMISGYSHNLCSEEALKLFMEMKSAGLSSTSHTLTSLLNACGSLTALRQGRQVHSIVIKMGSDGNVFVASALIDMYSKCGSINEAWLVFYQTSQKNSVLWTSMIMGYARSGKGSDALRLFEHLVTEEGFIPDHICYTAVLTACNHAGYLDRGIKYFNQMKMKYGLVPQIDQYASLIDLYARNGHLRKAKELMEEMPYDPNFVMWSSFLSSCRVYGEVELGKEAADQLFNMKSSNAAPYVTMANLYAEAGLWDNVATIWRSMKQKGIRKSAGWSWVEVDNRVNIFSAGDASNPQSQDIYAELENLNLEMMAVGCMPKGTNDLETIDDECLGTDG